MNKRIAARFAGGRTVGAGVPTVADLPATARENEWRWAGPPTTESKTGRWYKFQKGKWGLAYPGDERKEKP